MDAYFGVHDVAEIAVEAALFSGHASLRFSVKTKSGGRAEVTLYHEAKDFERLVRMAAAFSAAGAEPGSANDVLTESDLEECR